MPGLRGIAMGLGCAAFIAAFCYFHDCVINSQAHIRFVPHLMPSIVYGGLIIVLLVGNRILRWCRAGPALNRRELGFAVALALIACSVPFYGLVHCWPTALMLPHHYERVSPGWQREKIVELAPKRMLVDLEAADDEALTGYLTGLSTGDEHISPLTVPWKAWGTPMSFWVPLVLSIMLATIGLSLVVHRQWAHHEQLPYPISQFAHALLPGARGGSIFRQRGFQAAALLVLAIHMNNYAAAWWPEYLIPVKLRVDFSGLISLFPEILAGDGGALFQPRLMFAVVGIAYFFVSDVSFSLAITPYVMCYISGVLTSYGISYTQGFSLYNNTKIFLYAGGYLGIFLMVVYTGRYFYWNLFRRSIGLRSREQSSASLVCAMRVFLAGAILFAVQLVLIGLDWPLAILYTAATIMVFVVVSRAIAETGAFYIGTWIMPGALLWGFFGARTIGPRALVIMIMVSIVVLVGPGWAPMPFAVQALKMADLAGVKVSRTALWCGAALVLCIGIALPLTLYWQYDGGVMTTSSGWARYTPRLPFDQSVSMKQRLAAQGVPTDVRAEGMFSRLGRLSPEPEFVTAFAIGAGLALLVSFCRLRFAWWPLHPIVFVFFGTHQAQRLAFSFFVGWLIKTGISKYGGAANYQRFKPVMVGLIAGEVLAGVIPMIIGVIYYAFTGTPPVAYSLLL